MEVNGVSWELIAGIAAIVSTLCITYNNNPFPLHARRSWRGRWLRSTIWLATIAGGMASIKVLHELQDLLTEKQISSVEVGDLARLLFRISLVVYLLVSARVLSEIREAR